MTCQSVHCCRTLSVVCNVVWRTFCKVHPAQAPVDPRNLRITLGAHNGRDGQRLQSFTATHQNPQYPDRACIKFSKHQRKINSSIWHEYLGGQPWKPYQQSVRTCAQERSKQFHVTQPEGHPTRNLKHDNQIPRRRTYLYERCTVHPSHSLDQLKMLALRLRPHWGPMRLVCKWSALL